MAVPPSLLSRIVAAIANTATVAIVPCNVRSRSVLSTYGIVAAAWDVINVLGLLADVTVRGAYMHII